LAHFNRAVTNPIQLHYAWLLPPWVVICHRGRRSGRRYRTPVIAFRHGRALAIVVLYGEESDWVRNVLSGEAQVVRAARTHELLSPRLVDADAATGVSTVARGAGQLSGKLLVAEIGEAMNGFGSGPAAD
jgi:deazaflavin-dependent oxidoreductase (nitroreductase family)